MKSTDADFQEHAVLISVVVRGQSPERAAEYVDELEFLARTAGATCVGRFFQRAEFPDPRTYVGTGKLQEIKSFVDQHDEVTMAIFDDELSPTQQRNIGGVLNLKILDRTSLILDIFAIRARTAHARTQVQLAQYQYFLPRLTGLWKHLERQRGGIGMRGPGETQIETDRRIILDKIAKLKVELLHIDKQMTQQRKQRNKLVRVALVGYTNVGKSTIMNLIAKSDVPAEDRLFATLDTTVRKVTINDVPFLLSDTVGFIRKLPHKLIESFKSTLDEAREADLILHVVDISHKAFAEQMAVVDETLRDLQMATKPIILIFNKIDAFSYKEKSEYDFTPKTVENLTIDELKQTYLSKTGMPSVFISAKENINIDELKNCIFDFVNKLTISKLAYRRTNKNGD